MEQPSGTSVQRGPSSVALPPAAVRRLQRDLKEVLAEPLPCVTATPLENDLSQWHCNLKPDDGPYKGITFHVVLQFPPAYPLEPPSVRLCSRLEHPNVFYSWLGTEEHPYVCLDMLKDPRRYGEPYMGWSGAYSVQSLLLQLQSFLFAENIPQEYGGTARGYSSSRAVMTASRSARKYKCLACGFSGPEANPHVPRGMRGAGTVLLKEWWPNRDKARGLYGGAAAEESPGAGMEAGSGNDVLIFERESDDDMPQSIDVSAEVSKEPFGVNGEHSNGGQAQQVVLGPAGLSTLPDDCLVAVLERLDAKALVGVVRASARVAAVARERGVWLRRQLLCFTTKLSYAEDILGIGLSLELRPASNRPQVSTLFSKQPPPHLKRLQGLSSDLTLVSREAYFEHHVRKGVWNAPFDRWLPLLLDEAHANRALPYLEATLHFLADEAAPPTWAAYQAWVGSRGKGGAFDPLVALDIIPKMMNGMVVSFMKEAKPEPVVEDYVEGCECASCRRSRQRRARKAPARLAALHASEHAIQGYCQLHHMLLALASKYPQLQSAAATRLLRFAQSEAARHKSATPDIGELLVLLSIVPEPLSWGALAGPIVRETFIRQVRWMLSAREGREYPELAFIEADTASPYRLAATFEATSVSRCLLMFQVAFLSLVRPSGTTPDALLAGYYKRYGFPAPGVPKALQEAWYRILGVQTWEGFFQEIQLAAPTELKLSRLLRESMAASWQKGYHTPPQVSVGRLRSLRMKKDGDLKVARIQTGMPSGIPWLSSKLVGGQAKKADARGNPRGRVVGGDSEGFSQVARKSSYVAALTGRSGQKREQSGQVKVPGQMGEGSRLPLRNTFALLEDLE